MEPLAVDLRLLFEDGGMPLRLNVGRALMARVVQADGSGRGLLNIAGAMIEAQLPANIRAGEQLRLVVGHLDSQRVVLELPNSRASQPEQQQQQQQAPAGATAQPPPLAVPLPGGGSLQIVPDQEHRRSTGSREAGGYALSLRYEAPTLGALDLRFSLDPASLRVSIAAAPGVARELASEQADQLREALSTAGGRTVTVTVVPRREPLDLYV